MFLQLVLYLSRCTLIHGQVLSQPCCQQHQCSLSFHLLCVFPAGTRTPGHIDPAAALTFAWPLLLPDEQWSEGLMQQVLALWLFVDPSPQAWQRLLDWLLARQQGQPPQQQQQQAAAAADGGKVGGNRDQNSTTKQRQQEQGESDTAGAVAATRDQCISRSCQQQQQQQSKAPSQLKQQQQQQQSFDSAAAKAVSAKQLQDAAEQLLKGLDLQPGDLHSLAQHMGPHAVLLSQRAGEGMSVEPGWKHWVFNQRPCFKVAFELLRPRQAAAIVHMQQRLRGKMVVQQMDYMRVGCSVVEQLQEWARWWRQQQFAGAEATAENPSVQAAAAAACTQRSHTRRVGLQL
jgi:hypothetical protein